MSTALQVVDPNTFVALAGNGKAMAAMAANMLPGEAFDESLLLRVPTPTGGDTQWVIQSARGIERTDAIEGILCGFIGGGVLWPSANPAPGTLPVLISRDLVTAEVVGEIPASMREEIERCRLPNGRIDWLALSYNKFGSGKDAAGNPTRGRLAKEQRKLFVLRANEAAPLLITAQPGSLKDVRKAMTQLSCPYYQAVVSLTLARAQNSTGQPFARIVLRQLAELPDDAAALVKSTYADPIRALANAPVKAGPDVAFGADEMQFGDGDGA